MFWKNSYFSIIRLSIGVSAHKPYSLCAEGNSVECELRHEKQQTDKKCVKGPIHSKGPHKL